MIEINLVPDVKQELIRAERVRAIVISVAMLTGIAAVGIVIAIGAWVLIVQTARGALLDNTIKSESAQLSAVKDLESSLTIQNQLGMLPALHEGKNTNARIFDTLATISPAAPNEISISKLVIDAENKTIAIEAQAAGGYSALEVFKKTIAATKFHFTKDGSEEVRPLAVSISDGERSYGEDAEGKTVLRFALTFEYPEELFMAYVKDAKLVGPGSKTDVTDSSLGIPKSLFSPKANDSEGGDS